MLNFNAKTEIDKEKSESAILDTERIFSENSTTYAPYGNRGDKQYIIWYEWREDTNGIVLNKY